MRLAQIEDGVVINVAVVDADAIPDFMADWVPTDAAGPGWLATGGKGKVTFAAPPDPEPAPEPVPFLDFLEAQVAARKLTEGEAIAWAAGTIPAAVAAEIDALPEQERLRARLQAVSREPVAADSPASRAFDREIARAT